MREENSEGVVHHDIWRRGDRIQKGECHLEKRGLVIKILKSSAGEEKRGRDEFCCLATVYTRYGAITILQRERDTQTHTSHQREYPLKLVSLVVRFRWNTNKTSQEKKLRSENEKKRGKCTVPTEKERFASSRFLASSLPSSIQNDERRKCNHTINNWRNVDAVAAQCLGFDIKSCFLKNNEKQY